jgi:hypothetical protein
MNYNILETVLMYINNFNKFVILSRVSKEWLNIIRTNTFLWKNIAVILNENVIDKNIIYPIEYLDLRNNSLITDDGIKHLKLKVLYCNVNITNYGIKNMQLIGISYDKKNLVAEHIKNQSLKFINGGLLEYYIICEKCDAYTTVDDASLTCQICHVYYICFHCNLEYRSIYGDYGNRCKDHVDCDPRENHCRDTNCGMCICNKEFHKDNGTCDDKYYCDNYKAMIKCCTHVEEWNNVFAKYTNEYIYCDEDSQCNIHKIEN